MESRVEVKPLPPKTGLGVVMQTSGIRAPGGECIDCWSCDLEH
jgi:hypothetical protein